MPKRDGEKSTPDQSVQALSDIDLRLDDRLRDPEFRREWFRAELEESVPEAYRALRVRRELTQTQLARLIGTEQPAICRFEQSTEAVWKFDFLLRMAEALDARLRLVVEAAEDVLPEYEEPSIGGDASAVSASTSKPLQQQRGAASALDELGNLNESLEHRGEPSGFSRLRKIDKGSAVRAEPAWGRDQPLQLSALSGANAASRR